MKKFRCNKEFLFSSVFSNLYIIAIYRQGMYSFNVVKLFLTRSLEPIADFAVNQNQQMI